MTLPNPDPESSPRRHTAPSLSTLLQNFAASFSGERVRVRDITESLGQRSFGFILLIFALPNSLPMIGIPGVSSLTGLPLLFAAVQMALGHERVYLPRWIAESSLATDSFRQLITKVVPWLRRIEKLMRPRLAFLTQGWGERLLGAFCVLLAILLILPIPLGNLMPALGILFVALGLIERDGICALVGIGLGIAAFLLLGGIAWVMLQAVLNLLEQMLHTP